MSDFFRDNALMLARSLLGDDEARRAAESPLLNRAGVSDAKLEVELRLESMVRGICQRVWIDSAAVAQTVENRVREALAEASVEQEIEKEVARQLSAMRHDIRDRVEEKIHSAIEYAIDQRLGDSPRVLASKLVGRIWDKVFGEIAPRRGSWSYQDSARKKRSKR